MSDPASQSRKNREEVVMICPIIQLFLPSLAFGDLRPRLEHAVRRHLASCETCRDEMEEYEDITGWLQTHFRSDGTQNSDDSSAASREVLLNADADGVAAPAFAALSANESSALRFAQIRTYSFHRAYREALKGGTTVTETPTTMGQMIRNENSPGISPPWEDAYPAEAFATGARRLFRAIARHWPDTENHLLNGGHTPC